MGVALESICEFVAVGFIEQYCAFRNHELPSINIQDVRQMFAILGYGCSFGILIYICEFVAKFVCQLYGK